MDCMRTSNSEISKQLNHELPNLLIDSFLCLLRSLGSLILMHKCRFPIESRWCCMKPWMHFYLLLFWYYCMFNIRLAILFYSFSSNSTKCFLLFPSNCLCSSNTLVLAVPSCFSVASQIISYILLPFNVAGVPRLCSVSKNKVWIRLRSPQFILTSHHTNRDTRMITKMNRYWGLKVWKRLVTTWSLILFKFYIKIVRIHPLYHSI